MKRLRCVARSGGLAVGIAGKLDFTKTKEPRKVHYLSNPSQQTKLATVPWFVAAILAMAAMGLAPAADAATTDLVVRGATAPEPGSTYRVLKRPAIADGTGLATVVFDAKIRSSANGGLRGIFTADPIAPDMTMALEGTAAPPAFFRALRRFRSPTLNSSGIAAFEGTAAGGDRGIYRSGDIAVTIVGDTAPGFLSGRLSRFTRPQITETQGIVLHASITAPGLVLTPAGVVAIDTIFMRCFGGDMDCTTISGGGGFGSGTAELLLAKNDPVPDRPGLFFCDIDEAVHASDWGISFRSSTKLDCGDELEDTRIGYFRMPYGGLAETLGLAGEASNPFPTTGGTKYRSFANGGFTSGGFENAPTIEDDGIVVFMAQTEGLVSESIIYRCDPAVCPGTYAEDIIRPATIVAPGVSINQFAEVGISNAGDISFRARVDDVSTGTRGKGVYVYRNATGVFERIAVKDFPVPGALGDIYKRIFLPTISPLGKIAFRAKVKSPGGQNTIHIYLID